MSVPLYLNELSLGSKAPGTHEARQRMERLVHVARDLTDLGAERPVRTSDEVYETDLAPSYRVVDWFADRAVDVELRRLWQSRLSSAPQPNLHDLGLEVRFEGRPGKGLGAAWATEGIAVSLASEPRWDNPALEVAVRELLDDGTVGEATDRVRHASSRAHVEHHSTWIRQCRPHAGTQREFWQRRAELFPDLLFCEAVKDQLETMSPRSDLWHALHRRLYELQDCARDWAFGQFDPSVLHGRPRTESESTLNQFSAERTFLCPDGQTRLFSWHVSITLGYRLHFCPHQAECAASGRPSRGIIVGYVGKHLRTATDPG